MQLKRRKQAGDTLVEVLLAFTIFGMAATTIIRTMNDGFARMFSSGQQSQVQSLMRGQAAIIQAAHNAEVKDPSSPTWDNLIAAIASSTAARQAAVNGDGCSYTVNKNRLYFDTTSDAEWTGAESRAAVTAPTKVATDTVAPTPDGISMWVEAKHTPNGAVVNGKTNSGRGYYDFYIKACWSDGRVDRQLKTVSRLYELVPTAAEGSPVTATPPPPPSPVQVTLNGSQYAFGQCVPKADTDREEVEGPPSEPLFSNGYPGNPYACHPLVGRPETTYSCTNYDVGYAPSIPVAGGYRLTLSYLDGDCGTDNPQFLGVGGAYTYRLIVYKNGVQVGTMNLPADGTSGTFDFGSLGPGDTVAFRWWNNHFIPPTGKDPDLVITQLRFNRVN